MSGGSGAADRHAGRPPGDREVAEAAAAAASGSGNAQPGITAVDGQGTCAGLVTSERGGERASRTEAPSDCNKNASERVSAASLCAFFSVTPTTLQFVLLSLLLLVFLQISSRAFSRHILQNEKEPPAELSNRKNIKRWVQPQP